MSKPSKPNKPSRQDVCDAYYTFGLVYGNTNPEALKIWHRVRKAKIRPSEKLLRTGEMSEQSEAIYDTLVEKFF